METNWHVGTAAEAIAAAQLARCGWDVSVQYGANQPEYDLIAAKGDLMLKVSVKGSNNGEWGLTQSFLEKQEKRRDAEGKPVKGPPPSYHAAVDLWLTRHTRHTIFFLVQFWGVPLSQLPRIYVATPAEVAQRLKETSKGRGDTILYEDKKWAPTAHGAGTVEELPKTWEFSPQRLTELAQQLTGVSLPPTVDV
ncbi:MAG TPA: group I intron-associated PD-(D/E)XK endonuclease [Chthoniobacter sp.]|jgi:hypothetical protein